MAYKVGTTTVIDDSGQIDYARITNGPAASGATRTVFDVSGTWTKPAGLDDNAFVTVELWGGGGGGRSRYAGAGGGAYYRTTLRAGDLPSSVAVTVGAGGVAATGGTSAFGTYAYAYGGGSGYGTGGGGGGAGGPGQNSPSSSYYGYPGGVGGNDFDTVGGGTLSSYNLDGVFWYGANAPSSRYGGGCGVTQDTAHVNIRPSAYYGGGGGGGRLYNAGGNSVFGGGGGAGYGSAAGTSTYGGNGGAVGVVGSVPGGGGAYNTAGGAGRVIVYC